MRSILFVCTGNICRSPTAEGVLRRRLLEAGLAARVRVDSAGTHGYHVGEPPDRRSIEAARRRGFDIGALRARKVALADFDEFDVILGLDGGHVETLGAMAPAGRKAEIALFLDYAGIGRADVPDPYYGGAKDFERTLDLVEQGVQSMLSRMKEAAC